MCARHTRITRIESLGREARAACLALFVEGESEHKTESECERERKREI